GQEKYVIVDPNINPEALDYVRAQTETVRAFQSKQRIRILAWEGNDITLIDGWTQVEGPFPPRQPPPPFTPPPGGRRPDPRNDRLGFLDTYDPNGAGQTGGSSGGGSSGGGSSGP